MKQDPYKVELADIAKEIHGDLIITYNNAEIKLTCKQLQDIKANGLHTDVMSCIASGLAFSGMSEDEINSFVKEANNVNASLSIAFEAPDDEALNIKSKEENPMMDQLVQAVENPE